MRRGEGDAGREIWRFIFLFFFVVVVFLVERGAVREIVRTGRGGGVGGWMSRSTLLVVTCRGWLKSTFVHLSQTTLNKRERKRLLTSSFPSPSPHPHST